MVISRTKPRFLEFTRSAGPRLCRSLVSTLILSLVGVCSSADHVIGKSSRSLIVSSGSFNYTAAKRVLCRCTSSRRMRLPVLSMCRASITLGNDTYIVRGRVRATQRLAVENVCYCFRKCIMRYYSKWMSREGWPGRTLVTIRSIQFCRRKSLLHATATPASDHVQITDHVQNAISSK